MISAPPINEIIADLVLMMNDTRPRNESQAQYAILLMQLFLATKDTPEISDADWMLVTGEMRSMALMSLGSQLAEAFQK
jgi:hypothetical protein